MRRVLAGLPIVAAACGFLTEPASDSANRVNLTVDGLPRAYEWRAPSSPDRAPVVLMLHGAGGSAGWMRVATGMAQAGTREGYVVVFGEAAYAAGNTWSGGCSDCEPGDPRAVDDVRYVDAILGDLAQRTSIDRNRVYVAGFSAGGRLAYRLACQRPNIVQAMVAVGALLHRSQAAQCLTHPISALVIFGDQDQTQPLYGSSVQFSVDSSAIFWAEVGRCNAGTGPTPRQFGHMTAVVLERTGCDGSVRVEAHTIMGFGHDWPRGGYDATSEALRLFGGR